MKTESEHNKSAQILMGLFFGLPLSYLRSFVAFKMAHWFYLPVELSIIQWFGIGLLYSLFTVKLSGKDDNETDKEYFTKICKHLIYLIIALGMSYLIHLIIK